MKREERLQQYNEEAIKPKQKNSNDKNVDVSIQSKQFLSINEAANLIGASSRTIQRLIAKGILKVGKIGRRSIIQRNEIDKLFQ